MGVHYLPVHQQPYYRETFGYRDEQFPHASSIPARTLSLPLATSMSDDDQVSVVAAITRVLESCAMTRPPGIAVAVSDFLADDDVRRRVEPFCRRVRTARSPWPEGVRDPHRGAVPIQTRICSRRLTSRAIERRVGRWMAGGQLALVSLHALSCYTAPVLEGQMSSPAGGAWTPPRCSNTRVATPMPSPARWAA